VEIFFQLSTLLLTVFESNEVLNCIRNDVESHDSCNCIFSVASMDHSEYDCLVVVVMTHGGAGVLYSRNNCYIVDELYAKFTDEACPSLKGKPRLFFIQACRGEERDSGHSMTMSESMVNYNLNRNGGRTEFDPTSPFATVTDPFDSLYEQFNHPDFLIVRSTMVGHVSYRDRRDGSWFIQQLCHELDVNGTKEDLLTLLTHVNMAIAQRDSESMRDKQILPISSMLSKLLIFNEKPNVATDNEIGH
jgi:caspase 7